MSVGRLTQAGAWGAAVAALIGLSIAKGWNHTIQDWGWPYWLVDYSDGFIRRGLAGEVFHLVFGRTREALDEPIHLQQAVSLVYLTAVAAFFTGRVASKLTHLEKLGFFAFAVWLAVAQVWSSLAYDLGYLDALILAYAAAAALLLRANMVIACGILILFGPFIHEYFVFLIPFVLVSGLPDNQIVEIIPLDYPMTRSRTKQLLVLAALGGLSAALVTFGVNPLATASQVAQMDVPSDQRQVLAGVTFSQGIIPSFLNMVNLWTSTPVYNVSNVLFFMLPTVVSCTGILFWRARPNRSTLLIAAAALFPMAALLIAWDLSRLLVITNLTGGLLFVLSASARLKRADLPVRSLSSGAVIVSLVSIVGALAYGSLPLIYAYFPPGSLFVGYPAFVSSTAPAVQISHAVKAVWNGNAANRLPIDIGCRLSSSQQNRIAAEGCRWVIHDGETLHLDQFLPRGYYRFQFDLAPTSTCSAGRVGLAVSAVGPKPRLIVKAGVPLGGQIVAQLDAKIGDDAQDAVRIAVSGLSGDGCAILQHASISKLGHE